MKSNQPRMIYGLVILFSIVSALHGCAAKAPVVEQGAQVTLTKVESRESDGKTEIAIEGTEPILQYTSFQLTEPLRLVIDIAGSNIGKLPDKIAVNSGGVTDVVPSQKDSIARLEIGLSEAVESKVYQSDGKLIVEFSKPAAEAKQAPETAAAAQQPEVVKPEAAMPPTSTPTAQGEEAPQTAPVLAPTVQKEEAPQPEQATAKAVTGVQAVAKKDGVNVVITGDGAMKPNVFMVKGNRLVVDIPGVRSMVRPSVIPVRKGGLDRVRVGQHAAPDQKVRVVLDLTKTMQYTVTPEGNTILIAMGNAPVVKTEQAQPQEKAAGQQQEQAPLVEKEAPVAAPQLAQQPAAPAVAPPMKQERTEIGKQEIAGPETGLLAGGSRYTGRKISLDLQDADLVNVMRLFAEVANLNIILAPDVKGKVTVRMVNIPWDQAMAIILKMNGLGYALEDHILRIASVGALAKEDEDEIKAKETKKKAEDLVTRIVPINYSTAATIEGTIKKSLSPRGETVTDARTNTIIVKDIARNVDEVVTLIKVLDKPIPQIMIEARIVEASLTFSRQIGVQWGGTFNADAAHGNPTGLTFPNSIGVTGGPTMGATPSGNGNFIVNMPAAAGAGTGGGAIGFTFGSISKALNLDLVLSALESTGEGKIISAPKVSALDNREAKIEQGTSIPYSTTSASGTQIQFIDAKLSLTVTPHATPDNKVFLKIQATKNAPNPAVAGTNGQPSIAKNEATTEILLADGETAVIGGIMTMNRTVSYTKVPFFGDLPLIGWLFKTKTSTEDKGELLIFITPRIVKQEMI